MELANRQTNRNRRVECDVCGKPMRSDNLKRHKQTHKDLLALPDNEIKKELEKRQEFKKKREEKIRKLEKLRKRMAWQFLKKLSVESVDLLVKVMMCTQDVCRITNYS